MKYITYKRFKELGLDGELNIPYQTEVLNINGVLYYNNKRICLAESENGLTHFSRNDDDRGLERGKLVAEIKNILAKPDKKHQDRWNKI